MKKTEGRLTFDFRAALGAEQPERLADPLSCVDFVVTEEVITWLIEVTDALKAPQDELKGAIAGLAAQVRSGRLSKEMLMKLYGTHAYLAAAGYQPTERVVFAVIIGLPRDHIEVAQRIRMRDQINRVVRRIGPSFHGLGNPPIVEVESVDSWNAGHPNAQISA